MSAEVESLASHKAPVLTITDGDSQSSPGYQQFVAHPEVLVNDNMGTPLSGSVVVFTIIIPEGSNATATFASSTSPTVSMASTDEQGYAECPYPTPGPNPGVFNISAVCGLSNTVTFELKVTLPIPSTMLVFGGDQQSVSVSQKQQFQPLSVQLIDKGGKLVVDVPCTVVWEIQGSDSKVNWGNGVSIVPVKAVQGVATSPTLLYDAGCTTGTFQVEAFLDDSMVSGVAFEETLAE